MSTIKWEIKTSKYSNGYIGVVGKWHCFSVDWSSGIRGEANDKPYMLTTRLPGLKPNQQCYKSEEAARERAVVVLDYWMEGLNN